LHQQGKSISDDGEWMDNVEDPKWKVDHRTAEAGASIGDIESIIQRF